MFPLSQHESHWGDDFRNQEAARQPRRSGSEPSSWRTTPHWPGREQAEGCKVARSCPVTVTLGVLRASC